MRTPSLNESQKSDIRVAVAVPIYNEASHLRSKILRLIQAKGAYPISSILLAENGSSDQSFKVCQELASEFPDLIQCFHLPVGDMGEALSESIRRSASLDCTHVLLTAADLPFEFTDFDQFLQEEKNSTHWEIYIGSKAHRLSELERTWSRNLASWGFLLLRKILLGIRVGDTQGTFFIKKEFALKIEPLIQSRGFFFTTELTYHALKAGAQIKEVPIVLKRDERKSSVKIFRDSWRMLREIFKLRFRS